MNCVKCSQHVSNCTCYDIQERLAAVGQGSHTAAKFCRNCNQHYARCKCVNPDFVIRAPGKEYPMTSLEDGTFKTLSSILDDEKLSK